MTHIDREYDRVDPHYNIVHVNGRIKRVRARTIDEAKYLPKIKYLDDGPRCGKREHDRHCSEIEFVG